MPTNDHYTAIGPGANGYWTDATRLNYGVNVQGNTAGVYAEALADSPGTRASPGGTGVCGWGDSIGVFGFGFQAGGLGSSVGPQPLDSRPTGVWGMAAPPIGSASIVQVVGVRGDCSGALQGTGVHGTSQVGIGVWGGSAGSVGVFGQAQDPSAALDFYAANFAVTAGVFGIGFNYGGVFRWGGPQPDDANNMVTPPNFANIQLTAVKLGDYPKKPTATPFVPPKTPPTPPDLPRNGQPGDILVVDQTGVKDAQVWICLASAPQGKTIGATWARVTFDFVFTTQPG
jgi:hypothetical protein